VAPGHLSQNVTIYVRTQRRYLYAERPLEATVESTAIKVALHGEGFNASGSYHESRYVEGWQLNPVRIDMDNGLRSEMVFTRPAMSRLESPQQQPWNEARS
jgi:hypothetical protein